MTSSWTVSVLDSFVDMVWRLTHDGMRYLFAFLGALAVALLLTPPVRDFARRAGMVDQPDARRIHLTPVPRGGGIALFIAFHSVLLLFALLGGTNISPNFTAFWHGRFLLASSLLLAIGFADDKYGLRPGIKLFGQIAVATILFISEVKIAGIIVPFPPWLAYLVTVFWIVGAINAFNLIDGMDGLSSGLSLIAAAGLAGALLFRGQTSDTVPYLILAGACLGFLRYNFHPASVFLGDSGSMFLGLCIATFPLMTGSRRELVASLGVPLLAMGVPIFDTMLAIWRRTARALLPRELVDAAQQTRVMQPDKDHIHHRVLRQTMNQRTAAMLLYLAAAALVLIGLSGMLLRSLAPGLFMIAFIVAAAVAVRHMVTIELWDTGRLLSRKRATLRQAVILPLYIIADVTVLIFAWMTARFFTGLSIGRGAFIYDLPVVAGIAFVSLVAFKSYQRVWSRATIRDYVILSFALLIATVVACGVMILMGRDAYDVPRFGILFFMCSFFPVVGLRVLRECVKGIVHVIERAVIVESEGVDRVVVLGGGVKFGLFLKELVSRAGSNNTVIVALLDDDINLWGRVIAGYRVAGGFDRLPEVVAATGARRVLITCDMEPEKECQIAAMLKECPVEIYAWRYSEERIDKECDCAAARDRI